MANAGCISIGDFALDIQHRRLRGDLGEVPLSPLSVRFLRYLAARPGHTISRSELIDELWDGNYLVGEQALNRLASETRKAARSAGSSNLIETVQKSGYRLNGIDPANLASATLKARVPTWAIMLFGFVIVVVGLNLLMDTAIGFIWSVRSAN